MSDLYLYSPEICDGDVCIHDCGHCYKRDRALEALEAQGEEEEEEE